jgi:hypothetical protein
MDQEQELPEWQRHTNDQEQLCTLWNAAHPVGTLCRYWTGVREGEGQLAKTRSAAGMVGGHSAVIWLEGVSGCIALSHVEAEAK